MTVVTSNFERKPNDLYETEPWAVHALLRRFPRLRGCRVWEPAAGNHAIADVLRAEGARVFTSDIVTYNRPHDVILDFVNVNPCLNSNVFAIITNPPYGPGNRYAVQFARNALYCTSNWVALLLTAKFDFGKTRRDLFADNPRFAFKIALLDRIQWFPGETTGTEDHAWYVWGPLWQGAPRLYFEGKQ